MDPHPAPPPSPGPGVWPPLPPSPPGWPEPASYPQRRWPLALLVIVAIVFAMTGVVGGAASGTAAAAATASTLAARGEYAKAIAVDQMIEARTGPVYIIDAGAARAAAGAAEQTVMAWAASLGRAGSIDQAVALYRSVRAPSLRKPALDALAALLYRTAASDAASAQYANAIQRLLEIARLAPATPIGVQAAQQLPLDQAGEAGLLVTAGRAADAVVILDTVVKEQSALATRTADSLFPSALLAAGTEDIAHDYYREALAELQRLVTGFPSSAQAAQAKAMLTAPQTVSGTLVTHTGAPVSGRVRLSSNYTAEPGGMYQTSPPFYSTTADSSGDFTFTDVPVGGPYVLEVFAAGGWTTLINPATNQPANPVIVTELIPIDLTFVVLPS